MKVTVRFFASSREAVGQSELALELLQGTEVQALLQRLASDYPKLMGHLPTLMVAVNEEYAERNHRLSPGDEVALIPPVSGGSHV